MDNVREALAELEDAINGEGFGCACMPDVRCATCKARDLMSKWVRPSFEKLREALSAQPVCDAGPYGPCPTPDACTCPPVPPRGAQPAEPVPLIAAAVDRVRNTIIVEGESPEKLREAIALRVADMGKQTFALPQPTPSVPTDFQLECLFDAVHEHGKFGREFREHARRILAAAPNPAAKGGAE